MNNANLILTLTIDYTSENDNELTTTTGNLLKIINTQKTTEMKFQYDYISEKRTAHYLVSGSIDLIQKVLDILPNSTNNPEISFTPESVQNRLTLHDAMALVLNEQPGKTMKITDLRDEIDRRNLYMQVGGGAAKLQQYYARAKNYPKLFETPGNGLIKLK